jgi:transposase
MRADHLLPTVAAGTLIADKAFDADEHVIKPLANAGRTTVMPSKANRKVALVYDRDLYKARHLIENFFAKLNSSGLLQPAMTKPPKNFLGAYASMMHKLGEADAA